MSVFLLAVLALGEKQVEPATSKYCQTGGRSVAHGVDVRSKDWELPFHTLSIRFNISEGDDCDSSTGKTWKAM